MIRSMTGYGAAAVESEALRAVVTVRSLNHRYLDLALHLPRRLHPLEPEIKRLVQERIHRGRVEVSVQASLPDDAAEAPVIASRPLIEGLVRALRRIQDEHGLAGEVQVSDIARFPGALEVMEAPAGPDGPRSREVLSVLQRALDDLEGMRRSEGDLLEKALLASLDGIEEGAARIEALSEAGKEARRASLQEKVGALCGELGLEDKRLYQEVVRLVDRYDVAEEVQRLRSHVAQAREMLSTSSPCGKRLDFLAQEMAREANTAGSKASSSALVQEVVRLKGEIEKLREQVQNVE